MSDSAIVKEALETSSPEERQLWISAIKEELPNLQTKNTWVSVHRRQLDRRPIATDIELKVKRDSCANSTRFKARFVAGGNMQVHGIDYADFYPPAVYFSVVPLCIALYISFR